MEDSLDTLLVLVFVGTKSEATRRMQNLGALFPAELHVVHTVSEFHAALDERAWDVVLVDDSERWKDPALALELHRTRDLETPVIVLSPSSGVDERAEALAAGAFDLVTKDDLPRLVTCIEHAGWIARLRQRCGQTEDRLRATEQLFRSVLSSAPVSIFATDERGVFTLHEGMALQKVGMVSGENVGRSGFDLFNDFPVRLAGGFVTGGEVLRRVLVGETLRGETVLNGVVFDNQFAPLLDADGRVTGCVGVAVDVTLRKHFGEELEQSRADLRAFAHRLAGIEEEERRRVARHLHDSVGQTLSAAGLNLTILRRELSGEMQSKIAQRLDDSMRMIESVTSGLRTVIADLQPPMLDREGLIPTLRWLGEVHGRRTGLEVDVNGGDLGPSPPATVSTAFVRIAQEALTNVSKHGRASRTTISVDEQLGVVTMTVADDGVGFVVSQERSAGWGLTIMRERAVAAGASLSVESRPGAGTSVRVVWRRPSEVGG